MTFFRFIFPIIILTFQFAIDSYVLKNWKNYARRNKWDKLYYKVPNILKYVFLIASAILFARRAFEPSMDPISGWTLSVVSIWYLPKLIIFPFILIKDIVRGVAFVIDKIHKKDEIDKIEEGDKETVDKGRREFVSGAGWTLAGAPFIMTANGALNTVRNIKVNYVDLPINNLPINFENYSIAQISDIHSGSFYDDRMIRHTRNTIDKINPDSIVTTGDFVNFDPREFDHVYKEFSKFSARDGIYSCLGNHDHYMSVGDHENLKDMINSSGLNLLVNETAIIEKNGQYLNIAGVDNTGRGQTFGDFNKVNNNIDKDYPSILLCHDPENWEKRIIDKTDFDVTLSGHTHGGQMVFNFLGAKFSPVSMVYKHWIGKYQHKDQTLYINTGLGTVGPRIRVGVPPEITVFRLKGIGNRV